MSDSQEQLFNRYKSLEFKLRTLSGVIQNPIKDMNISPEMLQDFLDMSETFNQEFNTLTTEVKSFILENVT